MKDNGAGVVGVMALINILILALVWAPSAVNVARLVKSDFEAPFKREIVLGVGLIPVASHVIVFMDLPDGDAGGTNAVQSVQSE